MDDLESLVSGFIETITTDREHPRAALVSTDGIERVADGEATMLGSPAVVVVTNARLIFIVPDAEMDLEEWSLYYGDIATVSIERDTANRVSATSVDDVGWRCTLPNANPEVLDAVTRHLRWVDHVRTRVRDLESTVERAADEIRQHASDMDWDAARGRYLSVRDDLDDLITLVQLTTPLADSVLAPELTDIERSLEEANVRLYIERARSQLELGRYLVEHEDYDRAADVLGRARSLRQRAAGQSDAVERADAFAFGRQRELRDDLERLGWEMETVAAEPVRQAHEAAVRARETDDAMAAVEYWETAVRRYDRILDLDWWEAAQEAAEEIDDVRAEREQAVDRLVRSHAELASERWNEGVRQHDDGDLSGALECCEAAAEHLERAHEFAVEFAHDSASELDDRLRRKRDSLDDLRAGRTSGGDQTGSESESTSFTRSSSGRPATDDPEPLGDPPQSDDSDSEAESTVGEADGSSEDGEERTTAEPSASTGDDSTAESGTGLPDSGPTDERVPVVRIQSETFATDSPAPGEWIPPSTSDIVSIETSDEVTFDLDEIGLPGDVTGPDDDNDTGDRD